jgi:hypothetical protein
LQVGLEIILPDLARILASGFQKAAELAGMHIVRSKVVDIPKLAVCLEIFQQGHSHRHPWCDSLIRPNLLAL